MSNELLEKYSNRLGIRDSDALEKSKEMLRLISTKGIKTANDSIKVVLAINLAANLCNTEFDRSMALKLSNVKEKEYTRQKEFVEKLLDLTKKWTLDEICAKLEINEVVKNDADRLLRAYRKSKPLVDDTDNASFLAMALYQSHKLRKIKNPTVKHKLIELSKIKGKTWKNFEEEWDGWIADSSPLADQKKRKGNGGDQFEGNDAMETDSKDTDSNVSRIIHEEVTYEEWRDNMITRAKAILNAKNT